MAEIKLLENYQPHEMQEKFHLSPARFKSIIAGVRAGKTHGGGRDFLFQVMRDRATKSGFLHYWVVAPNHPIGKVAHRELMNAIPKGMIKEYLKSMKELYLHGDILIEFKSAEHPETLVAAGLDGMWIDEAARVKPEAWMGGLRQRLSDKIGWSIFTTTPLGRNWYYKEVFLRGGTDKDYENFHFTTADNPHIDRNEIESAKAQLPWHYFAREYLASWDQFVGRVYPELDKSTHGFEVVSRRPWSVSANSSILGPSGRPLRGPQGIVPVAYIGGCDWGWSSMGALTVIILDNELRFWVVEESTGTEIPLTHENSKVDSWVKRMKDISHRYPGIQWFGDPSRPENIKACKMQGIMMRPAIRDIYEGLRSVSTLVNSGRLFALDNVEVFWDQMTGYRWSENKLTGGFKEEPVMSDDHVCDAVRYAIHTYVKKNKMEYMIGMLQNQIRAAEEIRNYEGYGMGGVHRAA